MSAIASLFGGGAKQKYTPVAAPAMPTTPTTADTSIAAAGSSARNAAAAGGLADTIKTSAQGAPASGAIAYKSLLGE